MLIKIDAKEERISNILNEHGITYETFTREEYLGMKQIEMLIAYGSIPNKLFKKGSY
jgi:hypothetical protein